MTVFKGYLTIIRRNLAYMLGFFGIFTAVCLLAAHFIENNLEQTFQPESVAVTVVDQDSSVLSRVVTDMLSRNNQVTLSALEEEALTEALYIRSAQYVLVIPEDFQQDFPESGASLQVAAVPDSAAGYYLDSQIDAFLNQVRICINAGIATEDAAGQALRLLDTEPEVTLLDTGRTAVSFSAVPFQYLPYMYLAVLIYSVSYVLKSFRNRDICLRLDASPVSPARRFLQGSAAFLLLFLVFWFLTMLLPLLFGGLEFYTGAMFPWYLANSLLMLADSASLAFLVGTLVHDDNAINAMANVLGLGCSFLCGIFVPLELLGENVLRFSRFLPFYWYEVINAELGTHTSMTEEMSSTIFQGFLIQAVFALAFFCLTLAVSRRTDRKA